MLKNLAGVLGVLCCLTSLEAATITLGGTAVANEGQKSSVAGATTVDFNGRPSGGPQAFTAGIASYSDVFARTNSSGDVLDDSSIFVNAIGASDLVIQFSQPIRYFGFYWGSPDPANTLRLFNGSTLLLTYTAQNLHDQLGAAFGSFNAAYVNFAADAGESYTRVVFSTGGSFPFESDNHAFLQAAPEPATWLTAVLGVVVVVRRRAHVRPSRT